jgi:hypothetical protein
MTNTACFRIPGLLGLDLPWREERYFMKKYHPKYCLKYWAIDIKK